MKEVITVKRAFIAIPVLTALFLTGCGSTAPNAASPSASASTNKCAGDGSLDKDGLGVVAYPSDCEVPAFPTSIKNYVLDKTVDGEVIRAFDGDPWRGFLTPYRAGNTNSCQPEIWVVRWRSQNPGVTFKMAATYGGFDAGDPTDYLGVPLEGSEFDENSDWVALFTPEDGEEVVGSAGYMAGPSCSQPVMKWNANSSDGSNLADISFEYQIWKFKQKI